MLIATKDFLTEEKIKDLQKNYIPVLYRHCMSSNNYLKAAIKSKTRYYISSCAYGMVGEDYYSSLFYDAEKDIYFFDQYMTVFDKKTLEEDLMNARQKIISCENILKFFNT